MRAISKCVYPSSDSKRSAFGTLSVTSFPFATREIVINGSAAIKIKNLQVPRVVEEGHPAVLNCGYTLDSDDEDGIVIKWYLKMLDALHPDLVYQWIPYREPQSIGKLKNRLTSYYSHYYGNESSTLHISNTSTELSGEYICKVSSFISEDTDQKNMLVFVPPSNVTIRQKINGSKQFIVCYADNVYPQPNLKIFIDDREVNISSVLRYGNRSTLYSIQATKIVDEDDTIPKKMSCQIDIPGCNYYSKVEARFYVNSTVNLTENLNSACLLLLLEALILLRIYVLNHYRYNAHI
ncbi:Immunoglobulin V-set domain [Popillia japonica]|uniref:Immunoglobulin V-set domain n=1 Tax=Popillia japonica TaxID=7064 RepID=A0AAW1I871_POPJA